MSVARDFPHVLAWLQVDADLAETLARAEELQTEARQMLAQVEERRIEIREIYQAAARELLDAGYITGDALLVDDRAVVVEEVGPDDEAKLMVCRVPSRMTLEVRRDLREDES